MGELTIFCDYHFEPEILKFLEEGLAPHRLALPATTDLPNRDGSGKDHSLADADIAFGQPGVQSLMDAKQVRWVELTSAGFTRYDTPEFRATAKARGLQVTNSSSVFDEPCAEHALAFMLAQARKLPMGLRSASAAGWPGAREVRSASDCLQKQSVVILGFGAIASRLIELLAPFQMKITGMRRQPTGDEPVPTVRPEEIQSAFATADHVVSLLPDNAASHHFISAERLGWMKPGAVFYNIGRGGTVDQVALAASLGAGHLGAAWLDVTEPEPLPEGHPLLTAPNCFITPHVAGGHQNESLSLVNHFLANFQRFLKESPLQDRIM